MRFAPIVALTFSLVLTGCRQPAAVRAPSPVTLNMTQPTVTDGSLWQPEARGSGVVSDTTARAKGDILTILVVEDVNAKRDRSMDTSRDQSIDAGVDQFVYPEWLKYKGTLPKVSASSNRSFKGGGTINDSGTVRAKISAQVTDVLPNGNLVVLGQKEVIVAGDSQVITLTGIVRPSDVLANNTVISTQIAEARINIYGSGPLNDAQRRTLVGKLFDWINLF
ncbi:MAG: flagellar basal body L-ring protein FlgH [Planctomycetota bacterium]|nr:flagellar basal body L-ring protein FlgH [Planctomycetota bacterium]